MTVSELINMLIYGELRNLSYVDTTGNIKPEKLNRLIETINLGLLDLYTKFFLKRKTIDIDIIENQYEYVIDDKDLIEIITTGLDNTEFMLKDLRTIYLYETNRDKLHITYKCRHKLITSTGLDEVIDLPSSYLNALVLFVASRLYTSIPNQLDGDLNEHTRYLQRYIEEIRQLMDIGLDVDDLDDRSLFHVKGFI